MYEICIEMLGGIVHGAKYLTYEEALRHKLDLEDVYARNNFGATVFILRRDTIMPLIQILTTVDGIKYIGSPYTDIIIPLTASTAEKTEYRLMVDALRTKARNCLDCANRGVV